MRVHRWPGGRPCFSARDRSSRRTGLNVALGAASLAVLLLSGCTNQAPTRATYGPRATNTPLPALPQTTAVPVVTNIPVGWVVIQQDHYTIAHPARWQSNVNTTQSSNGTSSLALAIHDPQNVYALGVSETATTEAVKTQECAQHPETATIAGVHAYFEVVEGHFRAWTIITAADMRYQLSAGDVGQPALQPLDDAILATFHPDNVIAGCAA